MAVRTGCARPAVAENKRIMNRQASAFLLRAANTSPAVAGNWQQLITPARGKFNRL